MEGCYNQICILGWPFRPFPCKTCDGVLYKISCQQGYVSKSQSPANL